LWRSKLISDCYYESLLAAHEELKRDIELILTDHVKLLRPGLESRFFDDCLSLWRRNHQQEMERVEKQQELDMKKQLIKKEKEVALKEEKRADKEEKERQKLFDRLIKEEEREEQRIRERKKGKNNSGKKK